MLVISFLKPYRIPIGIALTLMLTELTVELVQPILMAKIIDEGILKGDLSIVLKWGGLMIGLAFIAFAAGIINSFYSAHVSQSFGYDVRMKLFKKIQSFSFANFNEFPISSLITRMTNDVTQVQNTVFMSLRIMLRAPLLIIGGLIMALIVNVKLALSLLVAIPLLLVFLLWIMNKGGRLFRSVQERLDAVNGVMRENLFGMRLIKALLTSGYENKRFANTSKDLMNKTVSAFRLMEITIPILLLVMNLSILAVLWFGSIGVNTGNAQVGEVVAIINYATRISAALSIFSFIIMAFSRAKASGNRITNVLNTKIDLVDQQGSESVEICEGKVEFRDVSFYYNDANKKVLNDISFVVEPGETVAVLGATGSGKTSLFQLIPRLYDIQKGKILIDDQDIRSMKMEKLRKQIGYVPQEALLFSGSVIDNIKWGKEDASMEEIIHATDDAQIHETINLLPHKYETKIGQKGINLSGGQKQRLSIARALVRKPKILLLDDSTSALDLKTEIKLLQALHNYSCTTLIITQKISIAMAADRILLLKDGKLIKQGDHAYLLNHSSLYQSIYQSQSGKEMNSHAQTSH